MLKPASTEPDPQNHDVDYIVAGQFELIDPPNKLVFTWEWAQPPGGLTDSLVTVEFSEKGTGTDVTVTHEKLPSDKSRESHRGGWVGCLEQTAQ